MPLFEVLPDAGSRRLGTLHAVLPGSSWYFEALAEDAESGRFDDLPYFIEELAPPLPEPDDAPYWGQACAAGEELWSRVATDARVSASFRELATANAGAVARARELQKLLPS